MSTILNQWLLCGVCGLCCAGLADLRAQDQKDLLVLARDGNRAAIAAIDSVEFSYERVPWSDTTQKKARECYYLYSPAKFWMRGRTIHAMDTQYDGKIREYTIKDGYGYVVGRSNWTAEPEGLTKRAMTPEFRSDVFEFLLFSHWGPKLVSFYPFYELLDLEHRIESVERLTKGKKEIKVRLDHKLGTLDFWFDPSANYLVSKSVMVPKKDSGYRWECDVLEFAEPAPGVFVPKVVEQKSYYKGAHRATIRTNLSGIKANHIKSDDILRIKGISGMRCLDFDRKVSYKVDRDGNQVGPEKAEDIGIIGPEGATAGSESPNGSQPSTVRTAPSRPSTPWYAWVLGASFLVLVGVGIRWILVRRRAGALP